MFFGLIYTPVGLPRWCSVTVQKLPANVGDERHAVRSLGQKDPMEKGMKTDQYSCVENPMDRGAWRAMVHRVTKS